MRLKMNFEKLSFCIKSLKKTFFFARFCFKLYVRSSLQCRIQGLLSSNEIVSTVVKASISRKLSLSRDKFSAHNLYVRNNKTLYLFFLNRVRSVLVTMFFKHLLHISGIVIYSIDQPQLNTNAEPKSWHRVHFVSGWGLFFFLNESALCSLKVSIRGPFYALKCKAFFLRPVSSATFRDIFQLLFYGLFPKSGSAR